MARKSKPPLDYPRPGPTEFLQMFAFPLLISGAIVAGTIIGSLLEHLFFFLLS